MTMDVMWLIRFLTVLYISLYVMVMMNMNAYVPEPYMDEIFHYPMTERYFEGSEYIVRSYGVGNVTYWDPKITTFPGLYIAGAM